MEQNLKLLQATQINLGDLRVKLNGKQFEFNEANKELIESIEKASSDEFEIKEKVKVEAIAEFEKTKEKKLLGGIGIRILSKLIYSESDAMNWANENMPVALKTVLDKKQFETFAKSSELDFVDKEEKISVTFPKEITI